MCAQALMGPPMGFAAKMANYAAVCARLGQPPSPPPEPQLPVPLSHTKGILSSPEQVQRLRGLLEPPTTLLVQRAEPDGPQPPVTEKMEMLQVCQISETILVYLTGQHRQHPTLRASHGKSELTSKLNEGGPLLPESLKRGKQPCLTKDGESQPPRRLHRGALGPAGPPSISCLASSSPSTQTPSTALPSLAAADVSELEQAELRTCGAIRFRRAGSRDPAMAKHRARFTVALVANAVARNLQGSLTTRIHLPRNPASRKRTQFSKPTIRISAGRPDLLGTQEPPCFKAGGRRRTSADKNCQRIQELLETENSNTSSKPCDH